jgi:hypothetical protein
MKKEEPHGQGSREWSRRRIFGRRCAQMREESNQRYLEIAETSKLEGIEGLREEIGELKIEDEPRHQSNWGE